MNSIDKKHEKSFKEKIQQVASYYGVSFVLKELGYQVDGYLSEHGALCTSEKVRAKESYLQEFKEFLKLDPVEYSTGAPNHECNDFVLTALNDADCYDAILEGYGASALYKNNSYLNSLDLDQLDFVWINTYLKDRVQG